MIDYKCDACGANGINPNPEQKPVVEEVEIEVPEVDPKTGGPKRDNKGNLLKKKVKQQQQKKTQVWVQNVRTGKLEGLEVPEFQDVSPRCYIVTLKVGVENIHRHLCPGCLNGLKSLLDPLWKKMKEMV